MVQKVAWRPRVTPFAEDLGQASDRKSGHPCLGRHRPQHMQHASRRHIAEQRDVGCRWWDNRAAEIAMLACVPRDEIGFTRRLIARTTSMGNAMADDREGIDRS